MKKQEHKRFELNAGTGMVAGIMVGALIALIISSATGDQIVWSWTIPAGLASGFSIGMSKQKERENSNG